MDSKSPAELETLETSTVTRCTICGDERWAPLRRGCDLYRPDDRKIFCLARCLSCGHIMQHPLPSPDELALAYPVEYAPYRAAWRETGWPFWRIRSELTTWRRIRRLKRCATGTRMLEVGSGAGDFLYASGKAGWEVAAVEYSEPLVEAIRSELSIDIRAGELKPRMWAAGSFDLVVLWSVLEHVPNAFETLQTVCSYLRPAGKVFFQIPTRDGVEAGRFFKQYWALLELPRHLNFFGKESLAALCERAGLELTLYKTPLIDIAWCYFASCCNFANASNSQTQKLLRLALFFPLIVLVWPVMVVKAWLGRGTEAFAVAVKK